MKYHGEKREVFSYSKGCGVYVNNRISRPQLNLTETKTVRALFRLCYPYACNYVVKCSLNCN